MNDSNLTKDPLEQEDLLGVRACSALTSSGGHESWRTSATGQHCSKAAAMTTELAELETHLRGGARSILGVGHVTT